MAKRLKTHPHGTRVAAHDEGPEDPKLKRRQHLISHSFSPHQARTLAVGGHLVPLWWVLNLSSDHEPQTDPPWSPTIKEGIMHSASDMKILKSLVSKLLRPIVALGLLTGATVGTLATGTATASASPAPSIFVQHASYVAWGLHSGVIEVQVAGGGYTPGGRVWIGIASDDWNPSTHKSSWDYQWGTWVTASPRGFYPNPGGWVSATITVTVENCAFGGPLGLAASDVLSGASTPPARAKEYGRKRVGKSQINNTSEVFSTNAPCVEIP